MKRNAIQDLIKWKSSEDRKPMVLKGARQVGKTWLMKEFGQSQYDSYVYFNFDEEDELKSIFEANKNPHRVVELLSMISGKKILPEKTLIIFDEIQECPEALNTLKYFKEKANEYHVIAAGSLLGTLLAKPKSYPVGMVNLLDIYPLTFDEFWMRWTRRYMPITTAYRKNNRSRRFSITVCWKPVTITLLLAGCLNALPHG